MLFKAMFSRAIFGFSRCTWPKIALPPPPPPKLTKCGITGKFYNVLKNIYSNSCAFIRLSGYLSKKFGVSKGTEQGHPLSPDLFKIYLSDLSCLLEFDECPELSKKLITHLLWADDLIMLSLNLETA